MVIDGEDMRVYSGEQWPEKMKRHAFELNVCLLAEIWQARSI